MDSIGFYRLPRGRGQFYQTVKILAMNPFSLMSISGWYNAMWSAKASAVLIVWELNAGTNLGLSLLWTPVNLGQPALSQHGGQSSLFWRNKGTAFYSCALSKRAQRSDFSKMSPNCRGVEWRWGKEMELLPSDVINGPGVEAWQSADTFPAGIRAACYPCTRD